MCSGSKRMLISMPWVLAAAMNATEPKPAVEIPLAAVLRCEYRFHVLTGIRFAPSRDWLAVLVQHGPATIPLLQAPVQEGAPAHLLIISRSGDLIRPAAHTRGPGENFLGLEVLWWSPDSSHVASAGLRSVTVLSSEGTDRCEITQGTTDSGLGFVSGPLFVVSTGSAKRTLDFYRPDCSLALSEFPPANSYHTVAVPLDGDSLAFIEGARGVILTDALCQGPRRLKVDYWGGRSEPGSFGFGPERAKGRYTESGRVLCIGSSNHTHCFENDSGAPIASLPRGMRGRMMDASAAGPRIVYPYQALSALDFFGGLAAPGHGGTAHTIGCMVWDYREGKETFLWTAGRSAKTLGLEYRGLCALDAAGEHLAAATAKSVRVYELPAPLK